MQALVWEAPRRMNLREWEEPTPGDDEVIVDVAFAGICGSELGGYLGHNALRVPPLIMGHEFSGTISARGAAVGDRLRIGQNVTCNPMIPCGACTYCADDLPHLCVKRSLVGAHRPGAFAQKLALPEKAVFPLPDGMSLEQGALVEPVAVGVRIGVHAGDMTGRSAVVIGAGPIGLLAIQVLTNAGADRVIVSDIDRDRLEMARALGARVVDAGSEDVVAIAREATQGLGAHVTVDAVGTGETRMQSVAATRSAGLVLLSGLHAESSEFPASELIRREITVKGAFCYTAEDFDAAMSAIRNNLLRLDPWIVKAPLGEGGDWFDRLVDNPGNVSKVLLVP